MDTMQSNYVQVNQMTMDMLCIAVSLDHSQLMVLVMVKPEYLIPQHIYVRSLTPTSLVHDNVNGAHAQLIHHWWKTSTSRQITWSYT